jgi:hypothetical protein
VWSWRRPGRRTTGATGSPLGPGPGAARDRSGSDPMPCGVSSATELPDDQLADLLVRSIDPDRHEVAFDFLTRVQDHHLTDPHW